MIDKGKINSNGSQEISEEHGAVGKSRPAANDMETTVSENSRQFENLSGKQSPGKEATLGVGSVTRVIG